MFLCSLFSDPGRHRVTRATGLRSFWVLVVERGSGLGKLLVPVPFRGFPVQSRRPRCREECCRSSLELPGTRPRGAV